MAKPRVLVSDAIADAGVRTLEEGGAEVDVRTDLDHAQLVEAVGDYDAIVIRSATKVDAEVIDAADRLKVIGRAGIGVDNVDVDAATRRGIIVVNAPQSNIISAAEHTVALMLALVRRVPQAHASLVAGRWDRKLFMGTELHDKVLGVIGLGRVGTLVAQRCHAFGMRVVAHDPYVSEERAARLGIELGSLDDVLERADVITIHVPRTPENEHLIGGEELERCKDGAFLVNTSRGGILDEDAVADAVRSGKLGGAALDVFQNEPLESSPLFELDGVVLTPHLGASTVEAQGKAGTSIAEQVLAALRGDLVPNAVNLQAGRDIPERVRAYLPLAQKLGRLACALAASGARELEVAYLGEIAEEDTRVLTLSALRGFLQGQVHEPVTFVNAPVLAKDRGLAYAERSSSTSDEYLNLLRLEARWGDGSVSVAGTLSGHRNEPRLVEIDDITVEIPLTNYMAFFRYEDRPGVAVSILGPLASHGINIGQMQIGRRGPGEEAILALDVDSPIASEVFDEMLGASGISWGRYVTLEGT